MFVNAGAGVTNVGQNGIPENANVLKLAEPIEMPRTQNLDVKITIAPEVRAMIGTLAAPGVGTPLVDYDYGVAGGLEPLVASLPQLPYSVQLGLIGRRVKFTQYGQIPG